MRKRVVICAALLLALTMLSGAAFSISASAASASSSIKELEAQINKAEKEKQNLKNNISDLQKIKKELEKQKGNLTSYVSALDANVVQMESNIAKLKEQIQEKEAQIQQTGKQLEEARQQTAQQYESMKMRIRFMYESQTVGTMLEMLVSAQNFGDFLNRADYVNSIYAYDRKMWEEYQDNCTYIELCGQQLALEKEILDEQKTCVEEEQARVEQLIAEKQKEIVNFQTDIKNKEQAIKEYEEDIAMQDAVILELEKAVAKKKAEQSSALKYDGGMFTFPVESYTRLSSDFGWRIHPTLGVNKFHNGIDLAAPKGTPIYAAYGGEVVSAGYNASMGNFVMIDHGDELYTIYMHASKLYVSSGTTVAAGDTIAAVGTTGRSTGNHLHFGVRLNGAYVSPWNYLAE